MSENEIEVLDPAERAREKQADRDKDAQDLEAGLITREELAKRNGLFVFPRDKVRIITHK